MDIYNVVARLRAERKPRSEKWPRRQLTEITAGQGGLSLSAPSNYRALAVVVSATNATRWLTIAGQFRGTARETHSPWSHSSVLPLLTTFSHFNNSFARYSIYISAVRTFKTLFSLLVIVMQIYDLCCVTMLINAAMDYYVRSRAKFHRKCCR